MTPSESLSKAIAVTSKAFYGKYDKGGTPYILHCLAVMQGVQHLGFEVMAAAVMHDLLEACAEWTRRDLESEGFSTFVIDTVELLTRKEGEEYMSYVGRLSVYPETRAIKLADLSHNMNPARLPDLSEKTMKRMQKYHTAYQFLLMAGEKGVPK